MELKVRQARYYGQEEEMPREEAARILELKQELLTIDGLFAALSENEAFVIRHHVMEELDWLQTMVLFAQKWGADVEKSIRSMKALQEKGLRKVARILNKRIQLDVEHLPLSHPIETVRGRYNGCVKLPDWYEPRANPFFKNVILVNLLILANAVGKCPTASD